MENNNSQAAATAKEEREMISIRFSKKLVGEPFTRKEDGVEFRQISIPNQDPSDKTPWKTFVVRSGEVRDDKFNEKLCFIQLPKDGTTTVKRYEVVGVDQLGKRQIVDHSEKIPNESLKAMVEAYKTKERTVEGNPFDTPPEAKAPLGEEKKERPSLRGRMQEKKAEVSAKKAAKEPEGRTDIPIVPKKKEASL